MIKLNEINIKAYGFNLYLFFVILNLFFSSSSMADEKGIIESKCLGVDHEAIEYCSKLIVLEPDESFAFFYRGRAKYFIEDFQGAIFDFNRVIILSPKSVRAYSFRGNAKSKLKDYQGAIQDYSMIVVLDPINVDAYMSRGVAKFNLKDYRGAIEDFNKTIDLSANFYDAHYYRGKSKFNLKDYRGAILDFNQEILILEKIIERVKLDDSLNVPIEDSEKQTKSSKDLILMDTKTILQQFRNDLNKIAIQDLGYTYLWRGMSKLIIHEKNSGCVDLSKAGELGHDKAYDLIQKYCN